MRTQSVGIGPCVVPIYPISAFTRFPADIDMHEVWRLVGPTVQRNITAPLWLQFCAIYLEGLRHGVAVSNADHQTGAK
jgi:hypothetical protein